jgi:hypothetical protein
LKKSVRKITLHRETLRYLNAPELADAGGGATYPCYPATYAESCNLCPFTKPDVSKTNCA